MTKKTSENRHALIAALVLHFREYPKRFEGTSRELGQLIAPKKKIDSAQLTRVLDRYASALNQEGWSIGVVPQRYARQPRVWVIEPPARERQPEVIVNEPATNHADIRQKIEEGAWGHEHHRVVAEPEKRVTDLLTDTLKKLERMPARVMALQDFTFNAEQARQLDAKCLLEEIEALRSAVSSIHDWINDQREKEQDAINARAARRRKPWWRVF